MKAPSRAIICGACRIPVNPVIYPKPDTEISCPQCGARDSYSEVHRVCMEEVKHRFGRILALPPADGDEAAPERRAFKWQFRQRRA